MKNALKTICIAFSTFLCTQSWATILPPNNLRIPTNQKNTGLTEEQFNSVANKVEALYSPIVTEFGAQLKIDRKWENPRVNAGTFRDENGKHWHINLYGGFARHPSITEDGFALVICHELGHHIGGAPKKLSTENFKWSSNEGQADYFGTLKCLRKIFENEDNEAALAGMIIPLKVSDICESSFASKNDRAICIRTSMAGLAVSNVMADSQSSTLPSFETPATEEITYTMEKHPRIQCRLDTYFMGSACKVSHYYPVSQINEAKGTCHSWTGYREGNRPACWFRESE